MKRFPCGCVWMGTPSTRDGRLITCAVHLVTLVDLSDAWMDLLEALGSRNYPDTIDDAARGMGEIF